MPKLSLTHTVREPRTTDTTSPPLLILLHGVGSNEHDLMGLAPALDSRFLVVSARAPISLGSSSFGWYHVQFTDAGFLIDPKEAEDSRVLLLHFVDEVIGAYHVDVKSVYLMGFSQGSIMSLSAALTKPEKFAGVVGMSGRMLPGIESKAAPPEQLRGLPVMVVHGTEDQVISIIDGRQIRDALAKLPVNLTYREYPMGHQVSPESMGDIAGWLTDQLDRGEDWRSF